MKRSQSATSQQGAALIIVLWTSLFLSTILAVAIVSARIEARIEIARFEEFRQTLAAEDGLEYAALKIADNNQATAETISNLSFSSNDYVVTYALAAEAQKLDLNLSSEAQLQHLFEFLGVDQQFSAVLAARIADWRDRDDLARPNGAERLDYAAARNGESIGNRPFYSVDELGLVMGVSEELSNCVMPILTVFGSKGALSNDLAEAVYGRNINRRDEQSSSILSTSSSRAAKAGGRHAISVNVTKKGSDAQKPLIKTGVFRITGQKEKPYEWIAQFTADNTTPTVVACKRKLLEN